MIGFGAMNREKLLLAAGVRGLARRGRDRTDPPPAPQPARSALQESPGPREGHHPGAADAEHEVLRPVARRALRPLPRRRGGQAAVDLRLRLRCQEGKSRSPAAMLRMVHRINSEEFGVKDFKNVKVTCYTCHRGALKPATFPPAEPAPAAAAQAPSGADKSPSSLLAPGRQERSCNERHARPRFRPW